MDDKNGFYGVKLPHVQHFTTFWGVEPVQHHHWIAAISIILEGGVFSHISTMGDIFPNMEPKVQHLFRLHHWRVLVTCQVLQLTIVIHPVSKTTKKTISFFSFLRKSLISFHLLHSFAFCVNRQYSEQ